jgi:hypothetical protein
MSMDAKAQWLGEKYRRQEAEKARDEYAAEFASMSEAYDAVRARMGDEIRRAEAAEAESARLMLRLCDARELLARALDTPAATMPPAWWIDTRAFMSDDVPDDVKKARNQALLEAQAEVSLAGNRAFVGTRQQVLVEGLSTRDEKKAVQPGPDGVAQLTGRTMCDRIVVFDAPLRLVGRLVDVDITAAGAWSLAGLVSDGLADAVPLDDVPVHQIAPLAKPSAPAGV